MKIPIENYSYNKNILHIINSLHFGGAESTLTYYLIEAKRSFGKKMDVAVYRNETVYCKLLDQNGISVKNLGIERKYSVRAIWETIKLIKTGKYQLVFAQLFPTSFYVAIASLFFPMIIFILRETTTKTRRRRYRLLKILDRFIYSRYDVIACVDEAVERALLSWISGIKGKTKIIGKGIPLPKVNMNPIKNYDIVFVGRLVQAKGIETLLQAIAILKQKQKIKKAIIVGDGILLPAFRDQANMLNITDIVSFLGERSDIEKLLQQSRIFVLPSRWEGTPSSLLEAMAIGLPVIATKVGNIPNILSDGKDGLLIPPDDVDSLACAIEKLLSNQRYMKQLGSNARVKIQTNYSIAVYAKNLLDFFNEIDRQNTMLNLT